MKGYEKVYEEFWKEIVEDGNGNIILDQVKRELADYSVMLEEAPKVYEEISGLTKPLTRASAIISIFNDKYLHKEYALEDISEMAVDGKVSLVDIKEYLR